MSLQSRIERLEQLPGDRCQSCKHWQDVYVDWGNGEPSEPHPGRCLVCGFEPFYLCVVYEAPGIKEEEQGNGNEWIRME